MCNNRTNINYLRNFQEYFEYGIYLVKYKEHKIMTT